MAAQKLPPFPLTPNGSLHLSSLLYISSGTKVPLPRDVLVVFVQCG
jgi:hypothetical protein